jgi:hypothetical protein
MTEYIVIVGGVPQPINVEAGQVLNFQEATYSSSLKAAQELAGSHEYPEAKLKEDKVLVCGKAESNSSLVNLMQKKNCASVLLTRR